MVTSPLPWAVNSDVWPLLQVNTFIWTYEHSLRPRIIFFLTKKLRGIILELVSTRSSTFCRNPFSTHGCLLSPNINSRSLIRVLCISFLFPRALHSVHKWWSVGLMGLHATCFKKLLNIGVTSAFRQTFPSLMRLNTSVLGQLTMFHALSYNFKINNSISF